MTTTTKKAMNQLENHEIQQLRTLIHERNPTVTPPRRTERERQLEIENSKRMDEAIRAAHRPQPAHDPDTGELLIPKRKTQTYVNPMTGNVEPVPPAESYEDFCRRFPVPGKRGSK